MNHVKRIDEMAERLDQRERMRLAKMFGIKPNELESFSDELFELTSGGNYESVYEFAQMEGVDMDDVYAVIRIKH